MPLTPEDVHAKEFTSTRFRLGYKEDEVDAFLDEVESEIGRLLAENAEFRVGGVRATVAAPARPEDAAPAPVAAEGTGTGPGLRRESEDPALHTLLLAQRTADEAVLQAREEAERVLAEARERATRLEQEANDERARSSAESDRLIADARERATRLEQDAKEQHTLATRELHRRRQQLEAHVEELRAFEREYRRRVRAYLESQLRELDAPAKVVAASTSPPSSDAAPARENTSASDATS